MEKEFKIIMTAKSSRLICTFIRRSIFEQYERNMSEGPYRTNVLKFLDNDGNVLFVRVRCKVNRRGQPVDGFNVQKGFFEDNKKGGVK